MWVSQENMAKPIPNKARLFLDSLFCNMKSGRCLMAMHRNSMMGCHLFVSRWRSFRLESTEPWPSKLDINMVGHIIHLHTLSACQPSISSQMPYPVWWQGPGFGRWPSSIFWGVASSNETWRADACCKISHIVRWSSQCFLFFSREVCHSRHKACVTSHNNFPIQIYVSWISPWSLLRLRRVTMGHPSQQSSSHWRRDTQGTKQYPGHGRQDPCWSKGWWSQSQSYHPCWFKTPKQGRILSCGIKWYKHV